MTDNVIQMHPLYEDMKSFAGRTGFKYCAIRTLCLQGKLPFVAVGKRRLIPVEKGLEVLERMSNHEPN